ncbi:MAG: Mor transcription activator family protein [Bilifractor sp.]
MKSADDNFKPDSVEYGKTEEDPDVTRIPEHFNETYQMFAELLGEKAAVKVWKYFSGMTVSFPQKLYSKEYTREFIRENYGNMSIREISRKVQLSERRVRQIVREFKEEGDIL